MNIDRRQSRARKYLPDSLFDKAEAIVIESLRRQYWDAFTESEQYKKMDNFHWYKDRRVVPEDFFILRVLGRGGFGLVTGESDMCNIYRCDHVVLTNQFHKSHCISL